MLTFPGIGSSIWLKEIVICMAFTINHIWSKDPDKITWTATLAAIEDWPTVYTVWAASSTICITNPSFTYVGKTLVTFRNGFSISWPVFNDVKYLNDGGKSWIFNLSGKPISHEIKSGFSKTSWITREFEVIFLACHSKFMSSAWKGLVMRLPFT